MKISLTINEKNHTIEAPEDTPLLWLLRDYLNLTGTKFGCGLAQCGACTVLLDGQAIRSCVIPAASVAGRKIETIETKTNPETLALQEAWREQDVPQCGYCQPGQIMSASALLNQNKQPSDADIDEAMSGNICRCASYERIRSGIKNAAEKLQKV